MYITKQPTNKECKQCKKIKNIELFPKHPECIDGHLCVCKKCVALRNHIFYKKNIKRFKIKRKKIYWDNSEKIKKERKEYYKKNRIKQIKKQKEYYEKNRKSILEKASIYSSNPENRKRINKYVAERRRCNIQLRLRLAVSAGINQKLKRRLSNKNGKSTFTFLPYTIEDLMHHLERQFEVWMNWKNYGNRRGYWNIDHIIPDASFNYRSIDDEEFQQCWALSNLQPLEYIKNIKKSNTVNQCI